MQHSAGSYHLIALIGTLLVEGAGMAAWASLAHLHLGRAMGCALVANLLVHTLFWITQPLLLPIWPLGLYAAEVLVVLLEGALYARCLPLTGVTSWALSFALNLSSFLAGLWLWHFLD